MLEREGKGSQFINAWSLGQNQVFTGTLTNMSNLFLNMKV